MDDEEKDRSRMFEGYSSLIDEYIIDFELKDEEIEYLIDLKKAISINKLLFLEQKETLTSKIDNLLEIYYDSNINRKVIYDLFSEINKKYISVNKIISLINLIDLNDLESFNYDDLKVIDYIVESFSNDSHLRYKLDSLEGYNEIRKNALKRLNVLLRSTSEENKIRYDIEKHNIVLTNRFGGSIAKSVKVRFNEEEILEGKRIITMKKYHYPNINKAFSIVNIDGVYVLDIYLSDVPTFLASNRRLAEVAYQRGTTLYIKKPDETIYNIEMLPVYLSHKSLSLNRERTKNVITFNFVINRKGEILSESVYRNRIRVNHEILSDEIIDILSKKTSRGLVDIDIKALNELSNIMGYKMDLTSVPSRFINEYIKRNNDLIIYKDDDIYSINGKRVHATSPIIDFASNINLGITLNNNGLLDLEEGVHLLEDNIDEVINHLNYMERVKKYVYNNSGELFSYIKREEK